MSHPDLTHLRDSHHRLTAQRRVVWEVLHHSEEHLTAEQLHAAAQLELAELSRASVYRILVDLAESGHVREIAVAHGASRYETICEDDPHSDLVCNRCGQIEKLQEPALTHAAQDVIGRHSFEPETSHLVLYGICDSCRQSSTS
jgi:Fe2+ or Zn2+ uptake regulation protein